MVKITFSEPADAPPAEPDIRLTPAAAARVLALLAKAADKKYLRIGVQGGGCNGFSYTFALEPAANAADAVISHPDVAGAAVIIDQPSFILMKGAVIDFEETLEGSNFVIKNPNATSQCGCGNSFGV